MEIFKYETIWSKGGSELNILIKAIAKTRNDVKILQEILVNTSQAEMFRTLQLKKIPLNKVLTILITEEEIKIIE